VSLSNSEKGVKSAVEKLDRVLNDRIKGYVGVWGC